MIKTNNQKLQEPAGAKRVGAPHPDFFSKINKIVNFFARTKRGGFLFSTCDSPAVTGKIIETVIERAKTKNLDIKKLSLTPGDGEFFLQQVRAVVGKKPDGIVIAGLDESIALTKDQIIKDINLSRDILFELELPFLFCVSSGNISKFANQAQDLFLRRARGVVHFPAVPQEMSGDMQEYLERSILIDPKEFIDPESLNLRLKLLESQLKEAEEKKYPPKRIANEIALDLIDVYLTLQNVRKADELIKKYEFYFNLKDHLETLKIIGKFYFNTSRLDEALDIFSKCQKIQEKTGEKTRPGDTLLMIGSIYYGKGELDKALDFLLKSKKIYEKNDEKLKLGLVFWTIGRIYRSKGNWNKHTEYYLKAKEVFEKAGKQSLAQAIDYFIEKMK
ncbi:MAG: tetratricopeptide repeat protein [Candidatus Aminicenantes bacterium]|nr:tetratricopeptide repeat protein [Candidatus Aminicenantes bacterium]